jgi:ribosomal protein S18 acetylase RimI-like enzyme
MLIYELDQITLEVLEAFQRLIPQLTEYSPPPTPQALAKMAKSPATIIFLARYPDGAGEIVGTATLATFQSPTGLHGWIEDVVVDREMRHMGIGRALTTACLERARTIGLREVHLSSNPMRWAANNLYQSMGFIRRETNVYRYPLTKGDQGLGAV